MALPRTNKPRGQPCCSCSCKVLVISAIVFLCLILLLTQYLAQKRTYAAQTVYLFAYFEDEGSDGVHFAVSQDGLQFRTLNSSAGAFKPVVGDRFLRDPSLAQGPDGVFHLVWTCSWSGPIIGYSSSRDLIHWSTQRELSVMHQFPTVRNVWSPELFYDAEANSMALLWASTVPGLLVEENSQFSERGFNHRVFFSYTSDFRTFSDPQILFDPGYSSSDPFVLRVFARTLFFYKDDRAYPPQQAIRVTSATSLTSEFHRPSGPINRVLPQTARFNELEAQRESRNNPAAAAVLSRDASGSVDTTVFMTQSDEKTWPFAGGPSVVRRLDGQYIMYLDMIKRGTYAAYITSDFRRWVDVTDALRMPRRARHGTVMPITRAIADTLIALENAK
eukprot:TRINITY_DN5643_c0_g1_i1.p1 TRINITY_DN5643_c0_g1~~TRINITY_DN5643_c0_g1_i1.p1  ORF type:complete len:390 (-),score=56.04 TRINITY_DN5643_c0_g1_i1:1810-2979(-)